MIFHHTTREGVFLGLVDGVMQEDFIFRPYNTLYDLLWLNKQDITHYKITVLSSKLIEKYLG